MELLAERKETLVNKLEIKPQVSLQEYLVVLWLFQNESGHMPGKENGMIAMIKMALSYHEYPEQFLSSLDNLDSLLARSNKAKYHDCVIV